MAWLSRLANVFRAGRLERELDAELQCHLEERTRELTAAGMTREAAAEQAARRLATLPALRATRIDPVIALRYE